MPATPRYAYVTFPALRCPPWPPERSTPSAMPAPPPPHAAALGPAEQAFVGDVLMQIGVDAGAYRPETLARRIPAGLRALRAPGLAEARRAVALGIPPDGAVDALLLGVTAFFRDAPVFAALEERVVPELAAARHRPRVWSVGCSDGAELYSVAMLLAERDALDGSVLLGTDCRPAAVARARAGLFDGDAVRALDGARRARWCVPDGAAWRIAPALRAAVRFRTADALSVMEPGPWDLILCRNVTMYLRADRACELWDRLARSLRRGGVLVVGRAERPTGRERYTAIGPGVYRRDGAAVAVA